MWRIWAFFGSLVFWRFQCLDIFGLFVCLKVISGVSNVTCFNWLGNYLTIVWTIDKNLYSLHLKQSLYIFLWILLPPRVLIFKSRANLNVLFLPDWVWNVTIYTHIHSLWAGAILIFSLLFLENDLKLSWQISQWFPISHDFQRKVS